MTHVAETWNCALVGSTARSSDVLFYSFFGEGPGRNVRTRRDEAGCGGAMVPSVSHDSCDRNLELCVGRVDGEEQRYTFLLLFWAVDHVVDAPPARTDLAYADLSHAGGAYDPEDRSRGEDGTTWTQYLGTWFRTDHRTVIPLEAQRLYDGTLSGDDRTVKVTR